MTRDPESLAQDAQHRFARLQRTRLTQQTQLAVAAWVLLYLAGRAAFLLLK